MEYDRLALAVAIRELRGHVIGIFKVIVLNRECPRAEGHERRGLGRSRSLIELVVFNRSADRTDVVLQNALRKVAVADRRILTGDVHRPAGKIPAVENDVVASDENNALDRINRHADHVYRQRILEHGPRIDAHRIINARHLPGRPNRIAV